MREPLFSGGRLNLFAELKRRNVIRAAVLYVGAVWALAQGIAQLGPVFGAPDWITRGFIIAAVIGFPFWLALSWFYELTPDGLKRDSEVTVDASTARQTGRRLDRWIIGVLTIAVALLLTTTFLSHRNAKTDTRTATATDAIDKSIAVLPFENLSRDPDNAYFATGMQDEILTRLSKIGALKVISRTSTAQIASRPDNLPGIARKLGVAAILEGSVQKSGDTVLVNVQLIRAATDAHLWAESYNRKLDDVFAVQGEVASAVADALNAALTGTERKALSAQPTKNTKAYEFYLRGLALEGRFTSAREDLAARVDAYQKAVDLDPQFALAWAGLASSQAELYFNSDPAPTRLEAAKHAIEQAQRLAPDAAETWAALGAYRYLGTRDYEGAYDALSKALEKRPSDGLVVYTMGNVRRRQGHWHEALALQTKATQLDPLATNTWFNLGTTLGALRRYDDAQATFDRGLAAVPGDLELAAQKIQTYLAVGDLASAEHIVDTVPAGDQINRGMEAATYRLREMQRNPSANIAHIGAILKDHRDQFDPIDLAMIDSLLGISQWMAGDRDAARKTLGTSHDAFEAMQARGEAGPFTLLSFSTVSAFLDDRDESYRLSDEAEKALAADAVILPQAIQTQAFARMRGGDKAEAVRLLRKAQAMPVVYGDTAAVLRIAPIWNPLRNEPGFAELTRGDGVPLELAQGPNTPARAAPPPVGVAQ